MAQDAATTYTKRAPVEQYLIAERDAEIALARSAAPDSISRDAEVLVLERHGFETAVKGKNGFVCIVGRGWTSAPDSDFWNPKVRVPMCANAAGSGLHLQDARLINDRGEIVCTGVLPSGDLHAVLLIPVDDRRTATAQSSAPRSVPNTTKLPPQPRRSNRYHSSESCLILFNLVGRLPRLHYNDERRDWNSTNCL
jgi:hypothetical protein